jgi:hypothetical protein
MCWLNLSETKAETGTWNLVLSIRVHTEATTQVSACSSIKWKEPMCTNTYASTHKKSFSFPLIILKTHLHRSWIPAVLCRRTILKAFYLNFMFFLFLLCLFFQATAYVKLKTFRKSWKLKMSRGWKSEILNSGRQMNEFE